MGKIKKIAIGIGIAFVIFIAFSVLISIGLDETEDSLKNPQLTPSEIKSQALTNISYDDLLRNNHNHVGKIVYYRGEVLQIQNTYGDTYVMRVGVTDKDFYYDDAIWVNYAGPRILQDDLVDIWGKVKGVKQYEAVLGNQIEIPEIDSMITEVVRE